MKLFKFIYKCKDKIYVKIHFFTLLILVFFTHCNSNTSVDNNTINKKVKLNSSTISNESKGVLGNVNKSRIREKLGHTINTTSNEYLPLLNTQANILFFSAMDRTGYFDFKLDFNKEKSAGGEDIFLSEKKEGVLSDARPLSKINTNGHEVATCIFNNGDLLVSANYPENFGTKNHQDAGVATTDLYYLKKSVSNYQIIHFPEPINSIYTESDAWMNEEQTILLFVSDRTGNIGEYHKKGWNWNGSFWGNTDIYVSLKEGDNWSLPINIGTKINTPFAERTPFLSKDGLTLYISSNGYIADKKDLDVYAFKRTNINEWSTWDGPYSVADANTTYDDWGYKEFDMEEAYVATAIPLGYKPSQGGVVGDGGIRETNYRPGYEIFGLQTASLNSEFETNIYYLKSKNKPSIIIDDVFFDFNSFEIKVAFEKYLNLIVDQINQNPKVVIEINGYTDNKGEDNYNLNLSLKRAQSLKLYFINQGLKNTIITNGYGASNPILPNTSSFNRSKNRRVEIYLK